MLSEKNESFNLFVVIQESLERNLAINMSLLLCFFLSLSLILQVWSVWIAKLIFKTKEKEKMSLASRFYDQTLVLKAWRGMKNLRSISKLKQLRYGMK